MADVVQILTIKKEVIMPGGDRTGPAGDGSLTGRRMGFCAGYDHPGFEDQGRGIGRGFGRAPERGTGGGFRIRSRSGGGRRPGSRHGYRHHSDEYIQGVSEKTMIENEMRILKDQLSSLEERLSGLGEEESK
jgi:hypothetical protein